LANRTQCRTTWNHTSMLIWLIYITIPFTSSITVLWVMDLFTTTLLILSAIRNFIHVKENLFRKLFSTWLSLLYRSMQRINSTFQGVMEWGLCAIALQELEWPFKSGQLFEILHVSTLGYTKNKFYRLQAFRASQLDRSW